MKSQMRRITKHLSPGLVIALIALLVALGGVSIAGKKKKSHKIGAAGLKPIVTKTAGGSVAPGTLGDFTATCDAGQQVISGGLMRDNPTTAVQLLQSHEVGNGWEGQVYSSSAAPHVVTVEAYCLTK